MYRGVGLPYVRFHGPSPAYLVADPDAAAEAKFLPVSFQLLQCDQCSEFAGALYGPLRNKVKFVPYQPNLPILRDWEWAWSGTPVEVHDRYERARDLRGGGRSGSLDESLGACRICLETVVRAIANRSARALPGNNLNRNIDYLYKQQLIDSRLRAIAHEVRVLANPAVHGQKPILDTDASRDGRVHFFRIDGIVTFFHLEALIAHVFFHPILQLTHESDYEVFFDWVNSVPAECVLGRK
jgi:hypothetical protein